MTGLETTISLSDVLNVIDNVKAIDTQAKDILFSFVFTIIGIVFITIIIKNQKFFNFLKKAEGLPKKSRYKKTPYENLEQPILDKSSLENIVNRISNNYRILVTIYGILLAFVVSDKISLIFSSWSFMIWTGWVLGVIIKAGWHLWEMSDLIERKSDLIEISRDVYNQKEFFKHMMILLAVAIACLPAVVYLHNDSLNLDILPWNDSITAFTGAFGVLSITFLFFMILHLFRFVDEDGSLSVYAYVGSLFVLFFVTGFNELPLEPQFVTLGGIVDGRIPTLFVYTLVFGSGLGMYPIIVIFRMILSKLEKNKINKIFSKISEKIKNEINNKEFRIGLMIEIVSLFAIFGLISLQEQFSSNFILDILNQIASFMVIFFLPGYMTFRKLKRDKIRNKINIIFFCIVFMTMGLVISSMAIQAYQESIPSVILSFPSMIFPGVDLSLLGFYILILPVKVIFTKYSFRIVVLAAIVGAKPGTTTDDDKYPY